MPKKSFKQNPALAFIGTQQAAQQAAQEDTQEAEREATQQDAQEVAQDDTQQATQHSGHERTQHNAQQHTQEVAHEASRAGYVKTQGRKGHKKPRINLAFDSDAFLDSIRDRADREGKSITQLVNEAVSYYLSKTK